MALERGLKLVKFLLLSFNFVFFMFGLTIMMAGILRVGTLSNEPKVVRAAEVTIRFIVVGFIFLFIAFIGCCGVWKENFCMVTTFAILLFFLVIMDIVIAIGLYAFANKELDIMDEKMQRIINGYKTSEVDRELIDVFHQMIGCCGRVNASDWVDFQPDGISVPDSCCRTVTMNCGSGAMNNEYIIYIQGCGPVLEYILKMIKLWSGVIAFVFAFIKIIVIVLACMLMYGIHKGYKRRAQPVSVSKEDSPHHRVK